MVNFGNSGGILTDWLNQQFAPSTPGAVGAPTGQMADGGGINLNMLYAGLGALGSNLLQNQGRFGPGLQQGLMAAHQNTLNQQNRDREFKLRQRHMGLIDAMQAKRLENMMDLEKYGQAQAKKMGVPQAAARAISRSLMDDPQPSAPTTGPGGPPTAGPPGPSPAQMGAPPPGPGQAMAPPSPTGLMGGPGGPLPPTPVTSSLSGLGSGGSSRQALIRDMLASGNPMLIELATREALKPPPPPPKREMKKSIDKRWRYVDTQELVFPGIPIPLQRKLPFEGDSMQAQQANRVFIQDMIDRGIKEPTDKDVSEWGADYSRRVLGTPTTLVTPQGTFIRPELDTRGIGLKKRRRSPRSPQPKGTDFPLDPETRLSPGFGKRGRFPAGSLEARQAALERAIERAEDPMQAAQGGGFVEKDPNATSAVNRALGVRVAKNAGPIVDILSDTDVTGFREFAGQFKYARWASTGAGKEYSDRLDSVADSVNKIMTGASQPNQEWERRIKNMKATVFDDPLDVVRKTQDLFGFAKTLMTQMSRRGGVKSQSREAARLAAMGLDVAVRRLEAEKKKLKAQQKKEEDQGIVDSIVNSILGEPPAQDDKSIADELGLP